MPKVETSFTQKKRGALKTISFIDDDSHVSNIIGIQINSNSNKNRFKRDLEETSPKRRVIKKLVRVQPVNNHTLDDSNKRNINNKTNASPNRFYKKRVVIKKRPLRPTTPKPRRLVIITKKRPVNHVNPPVDASPDEESDEDYDEQDYDDEYYDDDEELDDNSEGEQIKSSEVTFATLWGNAATFTNEFEDGRTQILTESNVIFSGDTSSTNLASITTVVQDLSIPQAIQETLSTTEVNSTSISETVKIEPTISEDALGVIPLQTLTTSFTSTTTLSTSITTLSSSEATKISPTIAQNAEDFNTTSQTAEITQNTVTLGTEGLQPILKVDNNVSTNVQEVEEKEEEEEDSARDLQNIINSKETLEIIDDKNEDINDTPKEIVQKLPDYEPYFPELTESLDDPIILLKTTILSSLEYETKTLTESRLRTYTFVVTRVSGNEQIVTSMTEVKPQIKTTITTETLTKYRTVTLLDLDATETLPFIPLTVNPSSSSASSSTESSTNYFTDIRGEFYHA